MSDIVRRFVAALLAVLLGACASGSAVVTGTKRPPLDSSQVRLYSEEPSRFEVVGMVNAASDSGWTAQGSQNYAIEELKKQAAKIGANGIVLASPGYLSPYSGATSVSGKAIFVREP